MGRKKAKGPETIGQQEFFNRTIVALGQAENPEISAKEALDSALKVNHDLAAIGIGQLVIQPPLEASQIATLQGKTDTIIGMGRKMVEGLAAAEESRQAPEPAFQGAGSSSKK